MAAGFDVSQGEVIVSLDGDLQNDPADIPMLLSKLREGEQGLSLAVEDGVADALARQGYEPEYGARPLRRVLRRQVENPLATQLLEERFTGATGVKVAVGVADGEPFLFEPQVD